MMDAFVSVEMTGRLDDFNEVFQQMLGFEKEELYKLTYQDLTPEKWHAFEKEIVEEQVLVRGYSDIYEKEYRRKDGTVFPIELRAVLLRNREGKPSGIWAIVRDITRRKWAECFLAGEKRVLESIARRTPLPEVLGEICRFIEDLYPGVLSSIMLLDPDGKRLWPAAAPSLRQEWVQAITPLPIGPSVGSCGAAAARKEPVIVPDISADPKWTAFPAKLECALKCGLRACWSIPILSGEGGVFGTFAMYHRDVRTPEPSEVEVITQVSHLASVAIEHERAAEALRRAREELEERVRERTSELVSANERLAELDRLKSQFLATMSHELRTPLNSIIGFSGILRQGFAGPVNAEQKKQLDLVFDSGKHLLSLINDLLDLSRIEAGKAALNHAPFDFAGVVEEVEQNLSLMARQKNLCLSTHVTSPEIQMVGDRKRCLQVLLNLANNALKFTNEGGVEIFAGTEDGHLRVSVSDTGIGIRPDQMGLLFEAFRQLDGSARRIYEGTGLGLYLCRKLLSLMHGEIAVESEPGRGSRFTFTVPLQLPSDGLEFNS
jgi:PAS domain S-box-containing protein